MEGGIALMQGIEDKSRCEEDYDCIWEHTELEMPGGYQENYLETISYMDQELKKRKRTGISGFRIINTWVISKVTLIDTII